MIRGAGKSDIGLTRLNNEDAFSVEAESGFLLVTDGMGGAAAGEVASGTFVTSVHEVLSGEGPTSYDDLPGLVQRAFLLGNDRIFALARENPEEKGMGCTAEVLVFFDRHFVLGHVGDSRTYLFRNGRLKQLTKDHSLVQDQVERGLISAEEAKGHALRNIIVRAVGVTESIAVDLVRGLSQAGDLFLLCSDGLTDMVDDQVIEEILSVPGDLDQWLEKLLEAARSAGGFDNITAVLCEVL